VSEKQYRDKIATIMKQQGVEEDRRSKASALAAKHRQTASRERAKITPRTSPTMARTYQRNAEQAEKKASDEDAKVAAAAKKLGSLASDLARAQTNLSREEKARQRRDETKRRAEKRLAEQQAARRRQTEVSHARHVASQSRPPVQYVHVPEPKPEKLRVLYLTTNPDAGDPERALRTDIEVRNVQEAVRRALHRDLITIDYRPAATAEDLIAGLNDTRPHVVHFSGHAGGASLVFDNASVTDPQGHTVRYDLLARALGATSTPPVLLVLNGCDTLKGAEVLLGSTAAVIATASSITDLAATVFATKFYAAIAAAQTIGAAVDQATFAIDVAGLDEGWKLDVLARDDIDVDERVLIQLPPGQ
jgi:hypothetical protein